ncbi:MAG: sulfur carrier protein ThiS [Odoribacteraceae bacterium]|nr:sulfur carrier protein ThiS [Odoribacteraceae bacterium]
MKVFINDTATGCEPGTTLKKLLEENDIPTEHVAVALDLEIIPRPAWDSTPLQEGSNIIIIKAAQGG